MPLLISQGEQAVGTVRISLSPTPFLSYPDIVHKCTNYEIAHAASRKSTGAACGPAAGHTTSRALFTGDRAGGCARQGRDADPKSLSLRGPGATRMGQRRRELQRARAAEHAYARARRRRYPRKQRTRISSRRIRLRLVRLAALLRCQPG